MPAMKYACLVTKGHSLKTQVRGVSIMEGPDIMRWVEQDELILSSLYFVSENPEKLSNFLDSLRPKPPCAFIIKLGRFVEEIPSDLLAIAEELGFAVIIIPLEQRYSEIMYPVMAALFESQVISLSTYKESQSLLTNQALKNSGIKGITAAFSQFINNPACVYSKEMATLYSTHPKLTSGQRHIVAEHNEGGQHYATAQLRSEDGSILVQHLMPIHVMEGIAGYLGIVEKNHPMSELDFVAMQNAMTVLSMEMLKNFAVREVERSMLTEVVEEILAGQNTPDVWERSECMGLHLNTEYALVNIVHELGNTEKTTGILCNELSRTVQNCLSRHGCRGAMSIRKNRTILFVQKPAQTEAHISDSLQTLTEDIAQTLPRVPEVTQVRIGYSSQFATLDKAPVSYTRACQALETGQLLKKNCLSYESLGVFKLLRKGIFGGNIPDLLPESLKLLMQHDEENNSRLIQTLAAYFSNNRNARAAARELFIHHKTTVYRLNQITDIGNIDFKNHSQLLELEFGLALLRMTDY